MRLRSSSSSGWSRAKDLRGRQGCCKYRCSCTFGLEAVEELSAPLFHLGRRPRRGSIQLFFVSSCDDRERNR